MAPLMPAKVVCSINLFFRAQDDGEIPGEGSERTQQTKSGKGTKKEKNIRIRNQDARSKIVASRPLSYRLIFFLLNHFRSWNALNENCSMYRSYLIFAHLF